MKKAILLTLGIASLGIYSGGIHSHTIQVSEDVGATFHLEPNDIAKAGQLSQVWIALTKKGGSLISLNHCDCKLSVYQHPRSAKSNPMTQPLLQPFSTEGYKNVPSTKIVFSQVGSYELELTGKPLKGETFKPFKFKFKVTVSG